MNRYFLFAIAVIACSNIMADSLLDPTRPASAHTGDTHENPFVIRVEAIVLSDNDAWAIVNGTVVHRGDHIANAVIEEISRYAVRYSRNGHSDTALLPHSTLQVRRNDASHGGSP